MGAKIYCHLPRLHEKKNPAITASHRLTSTVKVSFTRRKWVSEISFGTGSN